MRSPATARVLNNAHIQKHRLVVGGVFVNRSSVRGLENLNFLNRVLFDLGEADGEYAVL